MSEESKTEQVQLDEPYISCSQLSMMQKCGEQYYRRYIKGEKIPPGARLLLGKGVHRGRQVNLTQKIASGKDLPVEEVVQAARDHVHHEFANNDVMLEEGDTLQSALDRSVDSAVKMTECDYFHFQRMLTPVDVETKVTVSVPGLSRNILGILDTSDSNTIVRDLKTSSRAMPADAADKSDQLTTYALLYKSLHGCLPAGVQLDAVVKTKTKIEPCVRASTRCEADLDMILYRYHTSLIAIDKGIFVPCPSDVWWCSSKWCGYYDTCRYVRRGDNRPAN